MKSGRWIGWPADAECVLLDLGLSDAMGLSALEKLRAPQLLDLLAMAVPTGLIALIARRRTRRRSS